MQGWYVAHTHPRQEAKAAWHLRRQGFDTYLPRFVRRRRHARRVDVVTAPLFPRYIFVAMDVERVRWRAARSTLGVVDLICNGDVPALVPDTIIEEIKGRENESGLVVLDDLTGMKLGSSIRIMSGALCDQIGLFKGKTDDQRVIVLLNLLGRDVAVHLSSEAIAAYE